MGMDPVEFRRINCLKGGDILVTGGVMHPNGLAQCIDKAAQAIDWGRKAPAQRAQQTARQGHCHHVESPRHAAQRRLERLG